METVVTTCDAPHWHWNNGRLGDEGDVMMGC
jgi:hypothetical protein